MRLQDCRLLKWDQLLGGGAQTNKRVNYSSINMSQANTLFQKVASNSVELVIVINDFWYMITSFSIFIHDPVHIDDCADNSKYAPTRTVAGIRNDVRQTIDEDQRLFIVFLYILSMLPT